MSQRDRSMSRGARSSSPWTAARSWRSCRSLQTSFHRSWSARTTPGKTFRSPATHSSSQHSKSSPRLPARIAPRFRSPPCRRTGGPCRTPRRESCSTGWARTPLTRRTGRPRHTGTCRQPGTRPAGSRRPRVQPNANTSDEVITAGQRAGQSRANPARIWQRANVDDASDVAVEERSRSIAGSRATLGGAVFIGARPHARVEHRT